MWHDPGRKRRRASAALVAALLMLLPSAGCRKAAPTAVGRLLENVTSGTLTQGIAVTVVRSPIHPVERPDEVNSEPLEGAEVLVVLEPNAVVGTAVSDEEGRITLELDPGTYRLIPQRFEDAAYPIPPEPDTVVVPPGGIAAARFDYDTGIR